MNRRWRILILFLCGAASLLTLFAEEAAACSCAFGGAAPCQEYWRTDVVFAGTVLSNARAQASEGDHAFERRLVRFAVVESFRGLQATQAEVLTGLGGGDCGYGFTAGETYLVYAHRGERDNRLYTSICTRTRPLARAAEDLNYIRSLSAADGSAMIFGRVNKRNYAWREGEEPFLPVSSAELIIEGEAGRHEVRTDARGSYRLTGLAPGVYRIGLTLPRGLTDGRRRGGATVEGRAEVVAGGCAEVDFYLESETGISGRVVDAEGLAVANLPVEIRGAPTDRRNINTFRSARTDADGRFEIQTVPPGDYLLGFRLLSSSSQELLPYPRTYYPSVGLRAQAGIVTVKEGEHLSELELRLPPRLVERRVEGFVVWPDGRTAAGASIYLSLHEEGEMTALNTIRADEQGRFALVAYEGLQYKVSAYTQGPGGATVQSEWIELLPTLGGPPLRLVLPARAR